MISIITDHIRTYNADVEALRDRHGAAVHEMSARLGRRQVRSKLSHILPLVFPNIGRYRRACGPDDDVVAITWFILPLLVLIKLRLVPRPRTLVSFALSVNSRVARTVAMWIIRIFADDRLFFASMSSIEAEDAIRIARIPRERTTVLPFRERTGLPEKESLEPEFIFSGGFANRDYATFLAALEGIDHPVFIAAAERNHLRTTLPNVTISTAFDPPAFEQNIARSRMVVIPLLAEGGGSGQSVVLRAVERGKPLIVTRHAPVVDMLGADYPGFVEAGDVEGLRSIMQRVLDDSVFEKELLEASSAARATIATWPPYDVEIVELVRRLRGEAAC